MNTTQSFTEQMAAVLGLDEQMIIPYGRDKAKVSLQVLQTEASLTEWQ